MNKNQSVTAESFGGAKKIHFIGIGGIGVSAIVRMMLKNNKQVSGSNMGDSEIIRELESLGASVYIDHNSDYLPDDAELVIYSPAIPEDNPEMVKAKELGIPAISYPQALGLISEQKFTIAVSGTHGKTTTTAMIAEILLATKMDPTVVVGSLLKKQKTNFILGESDYFVAEACEYKRSFLNLSPNVLVITNIDIDHLDYFKDLADIQSAFSELVNKMGENDFVVCDPNNEKIKPVIKNIKAKVVDYTKYSNEIVLKIPGEHNIQNAQASLAVAEIVGLNPDKAQSILESDFESTWRRFEFKGKTKNDTLVYDDYAHNHTEVETTLAGARKFFGDKKITVIFQPHLYSRTKTLLNEFGKSFNSADEVIILPIYAAREKFDPTISSQMLVDEIKKHNPNVVQANYEELLNNFNVDKYGSEDVIITMGAGDVYKIGENILEK